MIEEFALEDIRIYGVSLIIPALIMVPNLLLLIRPPVDAASFDFGAKPRLLAFLEMAGRFGVCIIPLFYPVSVQGTLGFFCLGGMLTFLGLSYAGWGRFWRNGRSLVLLYWPLWGVTVPLAVAPALYFILSATLLGSMPMFLAALLFALGHVTICFRRYLLLIEAL